MERFRAHLNTEMQAQGFTDRTLAGKITEAGFPLGHTAIFKTRKGTRQPSLDECMWIAWALGYPDLDTFLAGPLSNRIGEAVFDVTHAFTSTGMAQRTAVHEAVLALSRVLSDPDAVAAMDKSVPDWRSLFGGGIRHDLRWAMRDLMALWEETDARLTEMFNEEADDAQA